ncbi:uncharacterized protein LOC100375853 [Saccoglossus kowalevskii]|uniref:Low-density lipoprotein receptor-related protein-like n=1 Tax=Saccoglossus kowalevskii TaxID=10224 RepID=A0ABM0GIU6_SACKO|nr:PREDICTED: low-density lipoprotein receptor-related protein-like [Saccoglossus kowalevskii]
MTRLVLALLLCTCVTSAKILHNKADMLEKLLNLVDDTENEKKDNVVENKREDALREIEIQERKLTQKKEALLGKRNSIDDVDTCNEIEDKVKGPFVMCDGPQVDGYPACVWGSYVCDSVIDCISAKDEFQIQWGCLKTDEQCKAEYPANGYFRCADNFLCVDNCHVCDGICDCLDGSDEDNCSEIKVTCGTYSVDTCRKYP